MNYDMGNSSGIMMLGSKGVITSEIYANNPTLYIKGEAPVVFDTSKQPNVNDVHAATWTEACKAGFNSVEHKNLTSSFDYSGPFTETVIMGNLALRSRDLREFVGTRKKRTIKCSMIKVSNSFSELLLLLLRLQLQLRLRM